MKSRINRKTVAIAATIGALAAGGAGIAYAVDGEDEEQVTGPDTSRAEAAALEAVGGGTVLEVEHQDGDGDGVYEVEVQRPDGSQVEVHLGGDFQPLGTASDDDGADDEDEGASDD